MSIFSRLRRRGDEGSAESPPNAPPSAPAPKASSASPAPPAARAPEPPKPPVKSAESPPPPPSPRASRRARPRRARRRAATFNLPVAGAIATAVAARSLARAQRQGSRIARGEGVALPRRDTGRRRDGRARVAGRGGGAGGRLAGPGDRARAESNAATEKPAAAPAQGHGRSTASDEAALRETFEELAVAHVTPIRNAMMEVRFGEAQASWLELGRPALKSLRTMASEVGHAALVAAARRFRGRAADGARAGTARGGDRPVARDAAGGLRAARPACRAPSRWRASAIAASRSSSARCWNRSPGFEPLMIDKLMAAGLGTLAQLFAARADEIAAVTGIPDAIAAAVADAHPGVPSLDAGRAGDRRSDGDDPRARRSYVEQLRAEHAAFEEAARGWTDDRSASQEAAPAAAAVDVPAGHDRARPPGRDRRRPAAAEAAVRAAHRRLDRIVATRAAAIRVQPPPPPPRPTAAPAPTRARTPPMWTPASTAAPIRWRPETAIQQKESVTHG